MDKSPHPANPFTHRNHNSKLLQTIKMIPAVLWLCLVWEFPVQLLRAPDTHTHRALLTLTPLPQERCSDLADINSREKPGCCARPWALLFPQPYREIPHVLYSLLGQQLAAVTLAWLFSLTLFSQLHGNWQQCKTRFGAVLLAWEASCSQPFLQNAEEYFHLKGEPKTSLFTHSHV